MTEEEKKNLLECSIKGFLIDFKENNYKNPTEALVGSLAYIGRHGVSEEYTKCSLNELVYVVKNEIAKMIAEKQLKDGEENLTEFNLDDDGEVLKHFIADPMTTISFMFDNYEKKELKDNKDDPELEELNDEIEKNIHRLARVMGNRASKEFYETFENRKEKRFDILNSIESKLPRSSIDQSMNRQKPGFFERIFRRTSDQYKAFRDSFNYYRDKENLVPDDTRALKTVAMAYLQHKFPNLGEDELPTEQQIARLSGAGKERASLALKVVQACRENETIQERADNITEAVKQLNLEIHNVQLNQNQSMESESFQEELSKDISEQEINVDNNIEKQDDGVSIDDNEKELE